MAPESSRRDRPSASDSEASLRWLGHATVLIELDGVRLLTDPVLRNRVGPLVRITSPARPTDAGRVDCVLLSHLHADHADPPTLRAVRRSGPVVAPSSAQRWLTRRGLAPVIPISSGADLGIGPVTVTALPAVHGGRRWPTSRASTSLGFLITGSRSVYFAGDTDLFPGMADLHGSVDVALLPVWGWGRNVGAGHLDPERAAKAAAMIDPVVAIPIHWGTYALPRTIRSSMDPACPAREFGLLVRRYAPGVEVRLLSPGAATSL